MGADCIELSAALHPSEADVPVKGQVIDSRRIAALGYGGQTVERGDRIDGAISTNPADPANSWRKQTVFAEHELPGTARP